MSELQKLDEVLSYLNSITMPNTFREFHELRKELKEERGLEYGEFELWLITTKLVEDNYLSTEAKYVLHIYGERDNLKSINKKEHRFYITYNGRMFINRGGYFQSDLDDKVQISYKKNIDRILTQGTIWLAVG